MTRPKTKVAYPVVGDIPKAGALKFGDVVYMRRLKRRSDLNRHFGVICGEYQEEKGRYPVDVDGYPRCLYDFYGIYGTYPEEKVLVKLENLRIVTFERKVYQNFEMAKNVLFYRGMHQLNMDECHYCNDKRKDWKLYKCSNCVKKGVDDHIVPRWCSTKCMKLDWEYHRDKCGFNFQE